MVVSDTGTPTVSPPGGPTASSSSVWSSSPSNGTNFQSRNADPASQPRQSYHTIVGLDWSNMSDLTKVILLGMAFDFARCIGGYAAKQLIASVSSTSSGGAAVAAGKIGPNSTSNDNDELIVDKDRRSEIADRQKNQERTFVNEDDNGHPTISTTFHQWKFYFLQTFRPTQETDSTIEFPASNNVDSEDQNSIFLPFSYFRNIFYDKFNANGRVGLLLCWLFLPPPLVLYCGIAYKFGGAATLQKPETSRKNNENNGSQISIIGDHLPSFHSITALSGMYLSSVLSSLGLLLWVAPYYFSSTNGANNNNDSGETHHRNDKGNSNSIGKNSISDDGDDESKLKTKLSEPNDLIGMRNDRVNGVLESQSTPKKGKTPQEVMMRPPLPRPIQSSPLSPPTLLQPKTSLVQSPPAPPPPLPTIGSERQHLIEYRPRSDSFKSLASECSVASPTPNYPVLDDKQTSQMSEKKYLEILVHNVSHTDLILGLSFDEHVKKLVQKPQVKTAPPFVAEYEETPRRKNSNLYDNTKVESYLPFNGVAEAGGRSKVKDADDEKYILCRPRFSAFDLFSRRVLRHLNNQISSQLENDEKNICSNSKGEECISSNDSKASQSSKDRHPLHQRIISYPRYERSTATARYTLVTPRPSNQFLLPVGFNLEKNKDESSVVTKDLKSERTVNQNIDPLYVDQQEMPSLRIRGRDLSKVDASLLGETPRKMRLSLPLPMHTPEKQNLEYPLQQQQLCSMQDRLRINAVFFPLLSTLLPRWLGQIADKFGEESFSKQSQQTLSHLAAPQHNPNVKKVVVLVSGVGTPRNWTHSITGNSTEVCSELMELFINVLYPDVTVVRIHSNTNIFRYDENITFATRELMPCIDSYRDAHARSEPYPDEISSDVSHNTGLESSPFDPDWRQSVSVTYSFADGSAARSHAIQAALRPYRPTYFHFWQLKTFWHESKITDEDIEVHSFEEMETVPALAVDQTSDIVLEVVNEMKAFRKDFIEKLKDGGKSDIRKFWLRKTKKPVLAVLLVKGPGGGHILYRGTNMEVSMPTGSLCAERNVIGTALASDPGLKREDLLMVAVLAVPLPEEVPKKYSAPPGSSFCRPVGSLGKDAMNFAQEVEEKLKMHQSLEVMRRSNSLSSFASIAENKAEVVSKVTDNDEWEMDVLIENNSKPESAISTGPKEKATIPDLNISRISHSSSFSHGGDVSGSSTPKRRISLYHNQDKKTRFSKMGKGVKKQRQLLLLQSVEDINPLKPCGACNEWLKKIAESNPYFKVLTFTDTHCNGVYVSPCQE